MSQPAALTSGMMTEGTGSNLLARRMLSEDRHGIAFVGYLDPECPGHRVSSAQPGRLVDRGGAGGGPCRSPVPSRPLISPPTVGPVS